MIFGFCLDERRENPIWGQREVVAKSLGALSSQQEAKMPLRIFPPEYLIKNLRLYEDILQFFHGEAFVANLGCAALQRTLLPEGKKSHF